MYGDVAVCSAIRRADGSAPLLVPAPGEWAGQCPLPSVGRARLPPLATCCQPGRGAVRCRGGGSASGIGCSSRRTLWRRCPVACPLHCLYARGGLRPGSELPPSLVHRARRCYRAVAWLLALPLRCPRAARRAGGPIPARAPAAGARHHPASLGGGGERSRVRAAAPLSRAPAGPPPPPPLYLSEHCATVASPAAPTRASRPMLGEELALGASPPLARRSRFAAPSHAAAAAVSLRATCRRG